MSIIFHLLQQNPSRHHLPAAPLRHRTTTAVPPPQAQRHCRAAVTTMPRPPFIFSLLETSLATVKLLPSRDQTRVLRFHRPRALLPQPPSPSSSPFSEPNRAIYDQPCQRRSPLRHLFRSHSNRNRDSAINERSRRCPPSMAAITRHRTFQLCNRTSTCKSKNTTESKTQEQGCSAIQFAA
ncbi:hypothetical protein LR48_Vigan07g134000 [Vigna angularis]|uniref:Uncharacterized protein n=1 Tax=Phaseolus angularis TaxID=3914 RepID=A0A0L9UY63_PHAAN|nr:hypothetical protein LR48_Vigan07g134000 [Vigna angularis]